MRAVLHCTVLRSLGAPCQGGKREEGDDEEEEEEEEEEEDAVWLLGRAHDGPRTREREGSEWPPDF